jgi:hypothetical protein
MVALFELAILDAECPQILRQDRCQSRRAETKRPADTSRCILCKWLSTLSKVSPVLVMYAALADGWPRTEAGGDRISALLAARGANRQALADARTNLFANCLLSEGKFLYQVVVM